MRIDGREGSVCTCCVGPCTFACTRNEPSSISVDESPPPSLAFEPTRIKTTATKNAFIGSRNMVTMESLSVDEYVSNAIAYASSHYYRESNRASREIDRKARKSLRQRARERSRCRRREISTRSERQESAVTMRRGASTCDSTCDRPIPGRWESLGASRSLIERSLNSSSFVTPSRGRV